ncbi:unnamed protein product [Closterium sp. Naga37s-1]|nr:unnamed protein product [Closterium sp. Naga37s-1]
MAGHDAWPAGAPNRSGRPARVCNRALTAHAFSLRAHPFPLLPSCSGQAAGKLVRLSEADGPSAAVHICGRVLPARPFSFGQAGASKRGGRPERGGAHLRPRAAGTPLLIVPLFPLHTSPCAAGKLVRLSEADGPTGKQVRLSEADGPSVAVHICDRVLPFLEAMQDVSDEAGLPSTVHVIKNEDTGAAILEAASKLEATHMVLASSAGKGASQWHTINACSDETKLPPGATLFIIEDGKKLKSISSGQPPAPTTALEWTISEFSRRQDKTVCLLLTHVVTELRNSAGKQVRLSEADGPSVAVHICDRVLPFLEAMQDVSDEAGLPSTVHVIKNEDTGAAILEAASKLEATHMVLASSAGKGASQPSEAETAASKLEATHVVLASSAGKGASQWHTINACSDETKLPPGATLFIIEDGKKLKSISSGQPPAPTTAGTAGYAAPAYEQQLPGIQEGGSGTQELSRLLTISRPPPLLPHSPHSSPFFPLLPFLSGKHSCQAYRRGKRHTCIFKSTQTPFPPSFESTQK